MVEDPREGFSYSVSADQIDRYKVWPLERRLRWLFYGNKLRKYFPDRTIEIQETFRQAKPLSRAKRSSSE